MAISNIGGNSFSGMPDWLASALGIGGGLGAAAGGAMNIFGKGQPNPADTANQYLQGIPGMTQPYYQPYQQAGAGALSDLQNQYKGLMSGDVQNQLGQNYQQSPGYQRALQEALTAGTHAAAAGGMLGSPMHQQQNMQLAGDIASKDYGDYMNRQMGLYGLGLGGEGDINKIGYGANKEMADMMANLQAMQAQYGYAGQAGQNQAKGKGWGDLIGGLGMAAGSLFGGPAGGAAGGFLGNLFGGK